jgi:hypothetical protein
MTAEAYLATARVKRGFNQPLNMRQLAAAYGIAYGKVRRMTLEPGFPMSHGLVFPDAFEKWMKQSGQRQRAGAGLPQNGAGKARVPGSRNGLPIASPRSAVRRLVEGWSPVSSGGNGSCE